MDPRITQRTDNTFIFEYEYPQHLPKLINGQEFEHEGNTYRVTHYHQVFGERAYCSFSVMAKRLPVKPVAKHDSQCDE